MVKAVLVQQSAHGEVRVDTGLQNSLCRDLRNTFIVLKEFKLAALNYPLVFTKNPNTGAFSVVALFGFDEHENLYLEAGEWGATYIPLNVLRGPFMLGTQELPDKEGVEHVLLMDMEDSRINVERGELLFNERGFPTPYLEKMTSIIKSLKDGVEETNDFIETLLKLNLIAPAQLKIEFVDGSHRDVRGVYTVDPDVTKSLSLAELQMLNEKAYLEPLYAMQISFGHVRSLIERKNGRLRRRVS